MEKIDIGALFDLSGKVAVVTGASRGIGKDMAALLAQAGASVGLMARNEEQLDAVVKEMQSNGLDAYRVACDLTNIEEIPSRFAQMYEHFGQIDILVNNAGINIPKPATEVSPAEWDQVMDINLKSVFFCSQAAGKYMLRQRRGKIINMSSQMAFVGYFNRSAYCSSKGGLMQLTRALAIEWAASRIHVNAIAPTFIETPMTRSMLSDDRFASDVISRIPLGRLAETKDLYGAVLYLASGSSDMVTGQTIVIDGGWTVW